MPLIMKKTWSSRTRSTRSTRSIRSTRSTRSIQLIAVLVVVFHIIVIMNIPSPEFPSASTTSSPHSGCDLSGLRVLVNDAHFEGNLGDEMETTPLLHFLRLCGAHVTAHLSGWRGRGEEIHPNSARNAALVDGILLHSTKPNASNFDVTISAPGPTSNFRDDIVFGSTIKSKKSIVSLGANINSKLVVVREPVSYDMLSGLLPPATKLFMSADLSFSFPFSGPILNFWDEYYREKGYAGSILVFSRANNFGTEKGQGVSISDSGTVNLKIAGSLGQYSYTKSFSLNEVVFASSSTIEDEGHFRTLRKRYGSKAKNEETKFLVCKQVEQLWALVKMARYVYTDRYHPGVAALIHGIPMNTIVYPSESVKMAGLAQLSNVSASEMKSMNQEAFRMLRGILERYRDKYESSWLSKEGQGTQH